MQGNGKKILLCLFLVFFTSSSKAYVIKGVIQLGESWEKRIYLSAIRSFDDMNIASEEFVIASTQVESDGSFLIQGTQVPPQYGVYRLHVVKKGDPVGTLIISGQEENHYHFVMNNESQLAFFSTGALFMGASFQNAPVNQSFDLLKKEIEVLQKAPAIPSKMNWDYQERQLQEYLLQYADTSEFEISALYAIHHVNIEHDYDKHKNFLRAFIKKWKHQAKPSPYFLELEQRVEFFRYRQLSRLYPYLIYIILFALSIAVFVVWKKRTKVALGDPFLEKQSRLTVQEQKIFNLLTKGKANKEISTELNIEISTVKSHLNNIYSKLEVKSRKEIYNKGNK